MNVFDFDKTIYDGDSSIDFFLFCLKQDFRLIRFIPIQSVSLILYIFRIISKEQLKSHYFSFFKGLRNIDKLVVLFWNNNEKKIKEWYKKRQTPDDCIISASPKFLLKEICRRLQINHLIATDVDKLTGRLIGKNCYAENKILFFKKDYPDIQIEAFFSDSKSDFPIAQLAKHAYIIRKNNITEWIV